LYKYGGNNISDGRYCNTNLLPFPYTIGGPRRHVCREVAGVAKGAICHVWNFSPVGELLDFVWKGRTANDVRKRSNFLRKQPLILQYKYCIVNLPYQPCLVPASALGFRTLTCMYPDLLR